MWGTSHPVYTPIILCAFWLCLHRDVWHPFPLQLIIQNPWAATAWLRAASDKSSLISTEVFTGLCKVSLKMAQVFFFNAWFWRMHFLYSNRSKWYFIVFLDISLIFSVKVWKLSFIFGKITISLSQQTMQLIWCHIIKKLILTISFSWTFCNFYNSTSLHPCLIWIGVRISVYLRI